VSSLVGMVALYEEKRMNGRTCDSGTIGESFQTRRTQTVFFGVWFGFGEFDRNQLFDTKKQRSMLLSLFRKG
jgi:hypothetical protein